MAGQSRQQRVGTELLQVIASVVLHNAAVAARLRLGVNDLQVLGLVQRSGRLTPGEVAKWTGLTTGSVTGVVDRLVKAGYAVRERDEADRRKVYVAADPQGLARIAAHYASHAEHLDTVLATRSAAELDVIGDFLADLNAVDTIIAPPPD